MRLEKFNGLTGNRIRDLPACSISQGKKIMKGKTGEDLDEENGISFIF
jgi:hypothetical protein